MPERSLHRFQVSGPFAFDPFEISQPWAVGEFVEHSNRDHVREIVLVRKFSFIVSRLSVAGTVFVGQNVAFDWGFLLKACREQGINLDTLVHYHKLDLASMAFGKFYRETKLFRFSLREMSEHFGVVNQDAHTALADARATFEVCKKVIEA